MEEDDLLWVLGAFPQPVFLTDGETVQWRNAAASAVLDPGASLQPMLQGTAFGLWSRRGTLRLSLPFGGALCDFSVRVMQRGLLFLPMPRTSRLRRPGRRSRPRPFSAVRCRMS